MASGQLSNEFSPSAPQPVRYEYRPEPNTDPKVAPLFYDPVLNTQTYDWFPLDLCRSEITQRRTITPFEKQAWCLGPRDYVSVRRHPVWTEDASHAPAPTAAAASTASKTNGKP